MTAAPHQKPRHVVFELLNALADAGWLKVLTPTQLKIVLKIMRHADSKREAYPSIQQLVDATGVDRSNVCRALNKLEKMGVLTVVEAGGGRKHATVRRMSLSAKLLPPRKTVAKTATVSDAETVVTTSRNSGNSNTETVAKFATPTTYRTTNRTTQVINTGAARPADEVDSLPGFGAPVPESKNGDVHKPAPARRPATGPHAELTRYFCGQWKAKEGQDYPFRPLDGKKVAELLKACGGDVEDAKAAVDRYLADNFHTGHPLSTLAGSQLPRYLVTKGGHSNGNGKHLNNARGIREGLTL